MAYDKVNMTTGKVLQHLGRKVQQIWEFFGRSVDRSRRQITLPNTYFIVYFCFPLLVLYFYQEKEIWEHT